MQMSPRPVLLFDVMDTLVYNPFNREIPAFFGLSTAALLAVKDPLAWPQFELGQIDETEYFQRYFRDRRAFDHAAFQDVVSRAYHWLEGAEDLLSQLNDAGFEMHALSNYPIWYQTIEARLGVSRYLPWTFVSCRTGVRKPAAEAFLGAARRLGRPVRDCLFVDDSVENCRAAEAIGMGVIHVRDPAQLTTQLKLCGHLA